MSRHVALLAAPGPSPVAAALAAGGYRVSRVAPGRDLAAQLAAVAPDVVFNGLSDALGRSGRVQAILELLAIPYTHSGLLPTALALDRHRAKIMFRAAGLPVTDHLIVDRAEAARTHQLPPPYVVKSLAGASAEPAILVLGEREPPPPRLLAADWGGGEQVMVERYLPGRTLGVAVMGDVALTVSEIVRDAPGGAAAASPNQLATPARTSPNIYEKLRKMSLKAHEVLGCRGVTRTTFRCNDLASGDTGLVCLEIDTQPDLTPGALVPEQARFVGHSYTELVAWMVEDASCSR